MLCKVPETRILGRDIAVPTRIGDRGASALGPPLAWNAIDSNGVAAPGLMTLDQAETLACVQEVLKEVALYGLKQFFRHGVEF
jgi:hypothetical protein